MEPAARITPVPPPAVKAAIAPTQNALTPLQVLLALEGEAMACKERLALKHIAVNKPRALIDTGHIFFLTRSGHNYKIEAISSQSVIEKNAPLIVWLRRQMRHLSLANTLSTPLTFQLDPQADGGFDYPFRQALYAPFSPDPRRGGLLFTRAHAWTQADQSLPSRLAQIYGLQWTALSAKKRARLSGRKKIWLGGICAAVLAALCIPVPVTTLAQAEIVAQSPYIVTAPMDGVIKTILVSPGANVTTGDALFALEDTDYENEFRIAGEEEAVADARMRRASLSAFVDAQTKRELAVTQAERSLANTRKTYAAKRLERTVILAQQDGIALFSDPKDWMGRPVATGQKIMEIADPKSMALRLEAPIADSGVLEPGAKVRVFLDSDPLTPIEAHLSRASYYAQPQADGHLAYEAHAGFSDVPDNGRIGARGVAKIYGAKAPLGYWLARRPITALRQFTGA